MPRRLFDKKELKNTPSFKDGIKGKEEAQLRRIGVDYIRKIGDKMNLPYDMIASATVLFHHFYMYYSLKQFDMKVTAVTCIMVAGKAEETPKKLRDILRCSEECLGTPGYSEDWKEQVVALESVLLQTIKFDVFVVLPHPFVTKFAKELKGDKSEIEKLLQTAWTFANDSLCTTLCLQWEPEIIAIAVLYLAMRLKKFEIVDWYGRTEGTKEKWWDRYVENLQVMLLEDICHQILDVYSNAVDVKTGASVTPAGTSSAGPAAVSIPIPVPPPNHLLPPQPPSIMQPPPPPLPPPTLVVPPPPPPQHPVTSGFSLPMTASIPPMMSNLSFSLNMQLPQNSLHDGRIGIVPQSVPVTAQPPPPVPINILSTLPPPLMYQSTQGYLPYQVNFPFTSTSVPPPPLPPTFSGSNSGQTVPPPPPPPSEAYVQHVLFGNSQQRSSF
uniref:Cyclin-like domain-containing protein n=1 Tax=Trichuris muris TaxID=70415 RepID=A0A5S6R255_TRIMR